MGAQAVSAFPDRQRVALMAMYTHMTRVITEKKGLRSAMGVKCVLTASDQIWGAPHANVRVK